MPDWPKIDLTSIERGLAAYRPTLLPADRRHAAVAMLLREVGGDPEILFIIRARHDRDPWSGDIGFPGGGLEPQEQHPRQAAERETREELGLILDRSAALGRLDDLYGATLPVLVSCFVYRVSGDPVLQLNHEVASTFWCRLDRLLDPSRHHMAGFRYRGRDIHHPAVDLLGPGQPVLWGITYRLLRGFFRCLDLDFGTERVEVDARLC